MKRNGRPPKYSKPDDLQKKIDEYFLICEDKDNPRITSLPDLAYYLGFESKQSLYDYEKRDGFSYPIKRARLKIESAMVKIAMCNRQAAGPIFILKNMGYTDRIDMTSGDEPIDFSPPIINCPSEPAREVVQNLTGG